MAILTISGVGQSFGAFDVFTGVSGSIPHGGKVALVGPNGIGKTTLLLILAGQAVPVSGHVHIARQTRLGYLSQEATQTFAGQEHTVYEEMLTVFEALRADEGRLRQLEGEMAQDTLSEETLVTYSQLQEQFEQAGGYTYELRIKQTLTGLGFNESDWQLSLNHLSGGQKTRALLARLLLEEPDLLILDEPTNHLDVEAMEWLEGTLKAWSGAVLIVSHDRYFLDKVVDAIWEMSRTGLQHYRGNYTAYVQQRTARWQQRQQAYEGFQQHIAKEMDFIRRNIAGQRTQMAQGKLSRLAREVAAVHAGGLNALARLKRKGWLRASEDLSLSRVATTVSELHSQINELRPPRRPSFLRMHINASHRSGELVLRTKDLVIGYPDKRLFQAEDIELRRLECAALIGPNGSGKSTFLRTILDQMPPLNGDVRLGASLNIGYFAQAHDGLNRDNTVLDELLSHQEMLISEARNYLARFLFRQDDVYKQIGMLSGGEQGRLALAILSLQEANFLLLDEPTNHLDIPAQEALQTALAQFEGTILMVTHDRYLVDRLATQVWEVVDGRLQVYEGGYREYLTSRHQAIAAAKATAEANRAIARETGAAQNGDQLSKNEQRKRAEALANLEARIEETETRLSQLTDHLQKATEAGSFDKIQELSQAYAAAEGRLEALMAQWENMAHE
jgi:ATP-binding cassette subfamily F protein 3